jgi:hypothetical protein
MFKTSAIVVAFLFASVDAVKISSKPLKAAENTCINVRKDTGIEEPCNTPGNSAWDEDKPIQTAAQLGLSEGFLGTYWMFPGWCGQDGYDTQGVEPTFKDIPTKEIMFIRDSDFTKITSGF